MTIDPSHIHSLSSTVATALESDRIGRPVFVRWMERVDSDPGRAVDAASMGRDAGLELHGKAGPGFFDEPV